MTSPERFFAPEGAGSGPDPKAPEPYALAARFARERLAKRVYFRAHCDLSVYRFLLDRVSHVAIIGDSPPAELDRRLRKILSAGESADLPADILQLLLARRAQARQHGDWVEGHYRPGRPLSREDSAPR